MRRAVFARSACAGVFAVFVAAGVAAAQQPTGSAGAGPAPDPADVTSIDAIIGALYASISGPVGQAREGDRLRSLFLPGAHMIPTGRAPDGTGRYTFLTVDQYLERNADALADMGFRETEVARVTERFGNIAHVFSTYEALRGEETDPFMRGINSIQLWNDGERWWIASIFWQQETPDMPIPARYRGSG